MTNLLQLEILFDLIEGCIVVLEKEERILFVTLKAAFFLRRFAAGSSVSC